MQFKVPQNIDMADRIVGPLTLVQFLYLLVGGIVVYFLFSTVAPRNNVVFLGLAGPIAVFTLALAFLRIQDQPFPKFVGAFFVFLFRPKTRIWFKDGATTPLVITPEQQAADTDVESKVLKRTELARLAQTLDTGGAAPQAAPAAIPPPNHLNRGRPVLDQVRK